MPMFRRKFTPHIHIEANQFHSGQRCPGVSSIMDVGGLIPAVMRLGSDEHGFPQWNAKRVHEGDWIYRDTAGQWFCLGDEEFKSLYEPREGPSFDEGTATLGMTTTSVRPRDPQNVAELADEAAAEQRKKDHEEVKKLLGDLDKKIKGATQTIDAVYAPIYIRIGKIEITGSPIADKNGAEKGYHFKVLNGGIEVEGVTGFDIRCQDEKIDISLGVQTPMYPS